METLLTDDFSIDSSAAYLHEALAALLTFEGRINSSLLRLGNLHLANGKDISIRSRDYSL
jgi:hypothetical protein